MNKKYVIIWKCDYSEEVYDSIDVYSGRIYTLESQGYEMGVDFDTRIIY